MAIRMQMNRFTSNNLPRPLVSTEPVTKPQKLPSPVAVPPAKPTPKIPSPIMPSAETLSSKSSQSGSNSSEVIEQQEQQDKPQEEVVKTTSEQELTERGAGVSPAYPIEVLTPSKLPESNETSQPIEPASAQNQEQPEETVRSTSEQELTERGAGETTAYPIEVLTPSKLPESNETTQHQEPPSSSSEPLQQPEEQEVPAQEESVSSGKIYYSSPKMRLPPPVD